MAIGMMRCELLAGCRTVFAGFESYAFPASDVNAAGSAFARGSGLQDDDVVTCSAHTGASARGQAVPTSRVAAESPGGTTRLWQRRPAGIMVTLPTIACVNKRILTSAGVELG